MSDATQLKHNIFKFNKVKKEISSIEKAAGVPTRFFEKILNSDDKLKDVVKEAIKSKINTLRAKRDNLANVLQSEVADYCYLYLSSAANRNNNSVLTVSAPVQIPESNICCIEVKNADNQTIISIMFDTTAKGRAIRTVDAKNKDHEYRFLSFNSMLRKLGKQVENYESPAPDMPKIGSHT